MANRLCNDVDLFTSVMPIKDHPEFLKRSLDFLTSQRFEGQIVIPDGSSKAMSFENKQIVDSQKKIKIVYVYTADISENMGWWIEMYQGLKDVEFKYSLLCPDDDFFFLDEIDYCLDFLENNEDYVSARGRFVWLWRLSEPARVECLNMPMYSFTEPVTEHRIVDMFNRYCHGFYDIVRRNVFLIHLIKSQNIFQELLGLISSRSLSSVGFTAKSTLRLGFIVYDKSMPLQVRLRL